MRIGAADAKRADAGAARRGGVGPGEQLRVDHERAVWQVKLWVGLLKMQRGRDHGVLERQDRLDQTSHTRRRVKMSDIGFQ